jgi:hypothetical protein
VPFLCNADQQRMLRDRDDHPAKLPETSAGMISTAIEDRPSDTRVTVHHVAATSDRRARRCGSQPVPLDRAFTEGAYSAEPPYEPPTVPTSASTVPGR